jgi:protein-S-isoprenylcysteine O-methyltransferase Ste14
MRSCRDRDTMEREKIQLNKYGRKELRGHFIGPIFIVVIFFAIAGTVTFPRAWIWAALTFGYYLAGMLTVYRFNPGLLNERGAWNRKKDTKSWDKILLQVWGTVGLYGHTALMALDAGRFNWSGMGGATIIPGIFIYTLGFIIVYWAMAVNPHFETTVRIQHDRAHRVVSRGPYRVIRHPGYAGLILANFGSTMIIGSAYGFITAAATLIVIGIRTYLEDRTLKDELEGYRDYCSRVKYRLIPTIW